MYLKHVSECWNSKMGVNSYTCSLRTGIIIFECCSYSEAVCLYLLCIHPWAEQDSGAVIQCIYGWDLYWSANKSFWVTFIVWFFNPDIEKWQLPREICNEWSKHALKRKFKIITLRCHKWLVYLEIYFMITSSIVTASLFMFVFKHHLYIINHFIGDEMSFNELN